MAPNTTDSLPPTTIAKSLNSSNNKIVNTDVQSFFDQKEEKAACGVGFVVNIDAIPSHKVRNEISTSFGLRLILTF